MPVSMFGSMSRAEWFKYGPKRLDTLIDVIKSGNPVPSVSGLSLEILVDKNNIKSVEEFKSSDDKTKTFTLKLKNGNTIESNIIGKSPIFGGKGAGAGATGDTSKGESLQCLYLEAMLNEGVTKPFMHFTPKLLEKYSKEIDTDVSFKDMMSSEAPWHFSAYVTAAHLISNKFVNKNQKFHRGSTIMKAIYKAKKVALANEGLPDLTDDKWNPGDIWAVKNGLDLSKALNTTSIKNLNASLKKKFQSREIVGISLKQVDSLKKSAKHEILNLDAVEPDKHTFTSVKIRGTSFWSNKNGMLIYDGTKKADIRAPSSMGAMNIEVQGKGARGGRAGYSIVEYAAKTFLKKNLPSNAQLKTEATEIHKKKNKRSIDNLRMMAQSVDSTITKQEFDNGLKEAALDKVHAKLGVTYIAYALTKSTKAQRNDFISYMINYAGSKLETSSVYVKVSAK